MNEVQNIDLELSFINTHTGFENAHGNAFGSLGSIDDTKVASVSN